MKKSILCVAFALCFAWVMGYAAPKNKTIKINERIYFSGLVEKKAPAGEGTMAVFLTTGLNLNYVKLLEAVKALEAIPKEYQNRPEVLEARKTLSVVKRDVIEGFFHNGTISDGRLKLSSGAVITGNFTYEIFENKIVYRIVEGKLSFRINKGTEQMNITLESPYELTRQWSVSQSFLSPDTLPFDWTKTIDMENRNNWEQSSDPSLLVNFWLLSHRPSQVKQTVERNFNMESGKETPRSDKVVWDMGNGYVGSMDSKTKEALLSDPDSSGEVRVQYRSNCWKIEKYHWMLDDGTQAEIVMTGSAGEMSRKSYLTGPLADLMDADLLSRLDEIPQDELNETIRQSQAKIFMKKPSGEVYRGLVSGLDLSLLSDAAKLKGSTAYDLGVKVNPDGRKTVILKKDLTLDQKEEAYQAELKRLEEERIARKQLLAKLPAGLLGAWQEYVRNDPSGFLIQGVYNFKKDGTVVYETRCGFSEWVNMKLGIFSSFAVKGTYTLNGDRLDIRLDITTIDMDQLKFVYDPACSLTKSERAKMESGYRKIITSGMGQIARSQVQANTTITATSFSDNEIQFSNGVRFVRPIRDILKK